MPKAWWSGKCSRPQAIRNVDEIERRALTAIGGVSLSTSLRLVPLPLAGEDRRSYAQRWFLGRPPTCGVSAAGSSRIGP
jgi:hypothetical protein